MSEAIAVNVAARVPGLQRAGVFLELTKPRIATLVLAATAVGFYLAAPSVEFDGAFAMRLFHAVLGTALVAGGANALNQVLEVEYDSCMARTQGRPIPSGRLTAREALSFGVVTGLAGVIYLAAFANLLAASLAGLSLLIYVLVYTPMKRMSPQCVLVGAISGALPPVVGCAAASGTIGTVATLLFFIVFFWQLPHFASISWMYREDYGRAGYPLLAVQDAGGLRLDLHLMSHAVTLLVVSLLPVVYGVSGILYGFGAMALGTGFLGFSLLFVLHKTPRTARGHVIASVIYLPMLLGVMMLDKVIFQ